MHRKLMSIEKEKDKNILKFILTGGTIDSYYDTNTYTAVAYEKSIIHECKVNVIRVVMKLFYTHNISIKFWRMPCLSQER